MTSSKRSGFTIIETLLFLSVSGILAAAIFVGVGSTINTQRYRDSVNSLQSFFQQQYSDVANVTNENSVNACKSGNNPRGQSDCEILGKYITTSDGQNLTIKKVLGYPGPTVDNNDDVKALKDYNLYLSQNDTTTYNVDWGSTLTTPSNSTLQFSILLARSPISGNIRTFSTYNKDETISTLLNSIQAVNMCVSPSLATAGRKMSVVLTQNATGPESVITKGDNSGC